jgi:voltage-gated potassium channel
VSRRHRIWEVVDHARLGDRASRAFDVSISLLIVVNVAAAVLETVDGVVARYAVALLVLELVSLKIFTIEFAVRWWASAEREPGLPAWRSRLRWLRSGGAVIDLLAIAPTWLVILGGPGLDARTIRALRLMRLFRLLKVGRYAQTLRTLGDAIRERREELVIGLVLTGMLLLIVSTLMYHVEHDAQPDVFSSIPATMWWGIATLTTVGYGDMAPVTPLGRLLGGLSALLGIGLFALPAGILSAAFSDALRRSRRGSSVSQPESRTAAGAKAG